MGSASFRNPNSGTIDTERVPDNNQEYSPLLGSQAERESTSSETETDSMPTKRALLSANLLGGPRAIATQVCKKRSRMVYDRVNWI